MVRKSLFSSCEVPVKPDRKSRNCNRYYPFQNGFTWKGIKVRSYKAKGDDWSGLIRQVLIGDHGETSKFHLRYFEIAPEGYSSFETHNHEHVVIGVRGKGKATLKKRVIDLQFLDVLYIKPSEPHRLYNPFEEPFGFFCIVNAKRDRPRPVIS